MVRDREMLHSSVTQLLPTRVISATGCRAPPLLSVETSASGAETGPPCIRESEYNCIIAVVDPGFPMGGGANSLERRANV